VTRQKTRKHMQRRHKQRGGSYTSPEDVTVRTVAGVPITRRPTVVMGNEVMSYDQFVARVEAAATGQIDPATD
jgi:hypothetical protein